MTEKITPNRKEFNEAKILRDIERALRESGIDISNEAVKATVAEYERLHSELPSKSDTQEIVVDGDMVGARLPDDTA